MKVFILIFSKYEEPDVICGIYWTYNDAMDAISDFEPIEIGDMTEYLIEEHEIEGKITQ